jgi:hypothetical protein
MEKIALFELNERDTRLIKKFTGAGVGIGASSALLLSLAGYLRTMREDAKRDPAKDDDTLNVVLPPKAASAGPGIAMAGLGLGALGSAVLTRKIMQALKRKDLEEQLDQAKHIWMRNLAPPKKQIAVKAKGEVEEKPDAPLEEVKEASASGKPMSISEAVIGSPVALALLMAAGSGTLAYQGLKRQFDDKKKPTSPAPKRVRFSYEKDKAESNPEDAEKKEASLDLDLGFETVGRMALAAAPSGNDFADMVGAVAQGRLDELRHNFATVGPDTAMELVKGAASELDNCPASLTSLSLAAVMQDPIVSPVARIMAHAELVDAYPAISIKVASMLAEDSGALSDQLQAMMALVGSASRLDVQTEVEAGIMMKSAHAQTWRELLSRTDVQ